MTERISDAELADCIEVARQEAESFAAHGHGRTRIKADTLAALRELADLREQVRWMPVTERLPPEENRHGRIQAFSESGGVQTICVGLLLNSEQEAQRAGEDCHWSHWREIGPLPGGDA